MSVLTAFVWVVASVGGYVCYRFKLRDMVSLAFILMNACIILLTLIGRILFDSTSFTDPGVYLLFALIILGVVGGVAFWLRKTAATMAGEVKESAK